MSNKLTLDLTDSSKAIQTVEKELLSDYGEILGQMLGDYGYDIKRFVVTIVNAVKKNPKLMQCTKESLLSSVLASAQLGLDIDSAMGYCYMIPYTNTKANCIEAKFIIGYKGIVELLYRSNHVLKVNSKIVYEKDEFQYEEGVETVLKHVPFISGDAGKRLGTYTVVKLRNGENIVIWVSAKEIEALKQKSGAQEIYLEANDPTGNMWKKAGIRQIIKYIPKQDIPVIDKVEKYDDKVLKLEGQEIISLPNSEPISVTLTENSIFQQFIEPESQVNNLKTN
jgi:recombination protein RecT